MGETSEQRSKGLLGDVSVSQVLATGLAAATSFALSAQIGIAGSIIGAVLGAVASSVATQVYRGILSASAEKLRALGESGGNADEAPREEGSISGRARVEERAASGTPIAPQEVIDAAHERAQARLRRRVALVAAATGIAAVLAFALVVSMATNGEGIGPSSAPSAPVAQDEPAAPEQDTSEPADSGAGTSDQSQGQADDQTDQSKGQANQSQDETDDQAEQPQDQSQNQSQNQTQDQGTSSPDGSVSSPTDDSLADGNGTAQGDGSQGESGTSAGAQGGTEGNSSSSAGTGQTQS